MMALVLSALMLLFYHSRGSELETYGLLAFHPGRHKRIAVTLLDAAGHDYPCDDSDGAVSVQTNSLLQCSLTN